MLHFCDFWLATIWGRYAVEPRAFLVFRVDHENLWRVEGRRDQGDFNKLLPSMLAPGVKHWSQAVL